MAETQTITEVKNFEDVIADFEKSETSETPINFIQQPNGFEEVMKENEEEIKEEKEEEIKNESFEAIVKEEESKEDEEEEDETPKPSDAPIYKAVNKLVEEGSFFLFSDKEDLSQYTEDELVDLIKKNDEHKLQENVEKEISEFFGALPKELQFAAQYVAQGGTDLRGLFKSLADTEDVKSLDPKVHSETIVRNYYSELGWGEEDINEKITTLKDLSTAALEKEATQVKPKLEQIKEKVVQAELLKEEDRSKKRQQESQNYMVKATEAIQKGVIGEIKLDRKTQVDLYSGLTQATYPSRNGKSTNELGHLLEKYQYVEPNFEKMYKVLWLLKNEEDFFEKFGNKAVKKEVEKTVRTLKTEQSKKEATSQLDTENGDAKIKKKVIKRDTPSFMQGINN